MGLFGKSKKDETTVSLFEDQIKCDGCGNEFDKSEMRKCKKCGEVICPVCRENHICHTDVLSHNQSKIETNVDDNNCMKNEKLINEYMSLSKSATSNKSEIRYLKKAAELGSTDAVILLYEKKKELMNYNLKLCINQKLII